MPISLDAHVYEIKMHGVIFGQETVNTTYWGGSAPATSLSDLETGFVDTVVNAIQLLVSDQWAMIGATVTHVKGGTDFFETPDSHLGSIGGDCLPPYAAWGFRIIRGGVGERNGYQRFAGVAESTQVNGEPTSAGLSKANAVAAALNAAITDGTTDYGLLIRREQIHGSHLSEPQYYSISSVSFSAITTQNSRKFGHGR
jgi:hypothetical protein